MSRIVEVFASQGPFELTSTMEGYESIAWSFAGGTFRRTLLINPRQDYAPMSMEVREVSSMGPLVAGDGLYNLTIRTEWTKISNVWVPIRTTHSEGRGGDNSTIYQVDIAWESVNSPVDATVFGPEGLGVAGFARVTDYRLGEPVVVDVLGDTEGASRISAGTRMGRNRSGLHWLFIGNVVLFCIAGAWLVFRLVKRCK